MDTYKIIDRNPIQGLRRVMSNNKYGLIDNNGNIICDMQYEEIDGNTLFYDRILVKKDNKYGFLDKTGKLVIEIKFDYYKHGFDSDFPNYAEIKYQNRWGVIDKYGNIPTHRFDPDLLSLLNNRMVHMEKSDRFLTSHLFYDLDNNCIPKFWIEITGSNRLSYSKISLDCECSGNSVKITTLKKEYIVDYDGNIISEKKISALSSVIKSFFK
jgi:hypothetical protein